VSAGLHRAALVALVLACAVCPARAQPRPIPADGVFPAHWPRAPLLDEARAMADVDVAWERFGVLGRGATICVVDTGIDLSHGDFRDSVGHTRVDYLLDLDGRPRGNEPLLEARFGGAVWTASEIDGLLTLGDPSLPTDWHGHGTAVASAAAGDGSAVGVIDPGALAGVAPSAHLVIVRALRRGVGGFADADVARGMEFCAAVSDPSRTVALASLGGHDGAHDGTSALEQTLASLVARGLTIVVAAGNDGGRAIHAASRIPDGATTPFALRLPPPADPTRAHVVVTVRGGGAVSLAIAGAGQTPFVAAGGHAELATPRGRLTVDGTRPGVIDAMVSGDATTPLSAIDVALVVRGPAEADLWVASEDLGATLFSSAFTGPHVVPGEEVTMPATSEAVIAVGASVSRRVLAPLDGSPVVPIESDDEGRAVYSSRGPSAAGAARPDLLAPGGWIVAARSSGVDPSDPEALVHGDAARWEHLLRPDQRLAIAGSSLSAAIVAGVLALAIEARPLDPSIDRALLVRTARREGAPFTSERGFGAVDAAAFLEARRPLPLGGPPVSGVLAATRPFATPGQSTLAMVLLADAARGAIPDDAWVSLTRDGVVVSRARLVRGVASLRAPIGRALPGSAVAFEARADDGTHLGALTIPIVLDDDGAAARPLGGTCATNANGAPASRWCAPLVVLGGIVLRARRPRGGRRRAISCPGSRTCGS
jgi:subtilisin family serine protease